MAAGRCYYEAAIERVTKVCCAAKEQRGGAFGIAFQLGSDGVTPPAVIRSLAINMMTHVVVKEVVKKAQYVSTYSWRLMLPTLASKLQFTAQNLCALG